MPCRSASGSLPHAISKSSLELHQPRHRVRAGAIHADFAVVIDRHERELRIELRIDDGDVQAVAIGDRLPVREGRSAERIHADLQTGGANGIHIDDVAEVVDIGRDEILFVSRDGLCSGSAGYAFDAAIAGAQQFIGAVLNPARDVGIGRASFRRIVFEAAIFGRIVRRRDDDSVGERADSRDCKSGWRGR